MLCVATIGRLNVRNAREAVRDTKGNLVQAAQRELHVEFIKGGAVPDYAKQEALDRLSFTGLPHNANPLDYLLWFDTELGREQEGWDDDELEAVEKHLRLRNGNGFIVCSKPALAAPYGKYDQHRKVQGRRTVEMAIKDITAAYETAGFNIDEAVAYERENGNDPRVIEALEALADDAQEDEAEPLIAA